MSIFPSTLPKKSVAVIKGAFDQEVCDLFRNNGFKICFDPLKDEVDLLCLTGGSDIHPNLYGEQVIKGTSPSPLRDSRELEIIRFLSDKPKVGICRGGQLLNVYSGGKMWQDIDGHEGTPHWVFDKETSTEFMMTSLHHQMMIPGSGGQVLLTADVSSYRDSDKKYQIKEDSPYEDIEAIWYPSTRSLCVQSHPELGKEDEVSWFFGKLHSKLGL